MAIPKAVQDQADKAEALMKARLEANARASDTDAPKSVPPEQAPQAAQPETQPQPQVDTSKMPGRPEDSDETWQKRYTTLFGKYQIEVPRMAQEIRDLKHSNQQMQDEIQGLRDQLAQAPAAQQQPGNQANSLNIDFDKLGASFDDEIVEPIRILSQRLDAVLAENAALKDQITNIGGEVTRVADNDKAKFWSDLASRVPDFPEIDQRDDWKDFLRGYDRNGKQWNSILQSGVRAFDLDAVEAVFETFRSAFMGKPGTPENNRPQPRGVPDNTGASTQPAQKPHFKQSEIMEFARRQATGRLLKEGWTEGRIKDRQREIDLAYAEGRVDLRR